MTVNIFLDATMKPSQIHQGGDWKVVRNVGECITALEQHKGNVGILTLNDVLGANQPRGFNVLLWLKYKVVGEKMVEYMPERIMCHARLGFGRYQITKLAQDIVDARNKLLREQPALSIRLKKST